MTAESALMALVLLSWLAASVAVVGAFTVRGRRLPPYPQWPPARPNDRECMVVTWRVRLRHLLGRWRV